MSRTGTSAKPAKAAAVIDSGGAGDAAFDRDKVRVYRALFDSFVPNAEGRVSRFEVLTRLRKAGVQPDDPRIQAT